ncbi:MAG: hypothetical protein Q8865_08435 [Bacillota bacterium]|nr:hypothetical protein [Bacillota bacterium]
MNLSEKVSYLKGLMEGLGIDPNSKEGKLFAAITDVLGDAAASIEDLDDEVAALNELVDEVDEDLGNVEEEVYGAEEDYDDDDDEIYYDVKCPKCGEVIGLDEELAEDGEVICPTCGEHFEFDLPDEDEYCDDGCDCGHNHEEE